MGTLSCKRCGATAEGSDQKEADDRIDHSRGSMIGFPCSGNQQDLVWDGTEGKRSKRETVVVEEVQEKPKKSKRR